jgi:opacity protein-like surface antigen
MKNGLLLLFLFSSNIVAEVLEPVDTLPKKEVVIDSSMESNARFDLSDYAQKLYFGLGIGAIRADAKQDAKAASMSILAGVTLSDYASLEARYTTLIADADVGNSVTSIDISNASLFLKQYLPISEAFSPYGMIGYGITYYKDENDRSLEWGAGLNYNYSNSGSVFFEYMSYYNDDFGNTFDKSIDIAAYNFGTAFKF